MDSSSTDVGLEVGSLILTELLFSLFSKGAALCCFFGPWMEVANSAQEAGALGSDDGYREPPAQLVEQEALFRIREVPALNLGYVGCLGLGQLG